MSEVEQLAEEQFSTFRKRFCEMISEIAEECRSAFIQGYAKGETDEKFRTKQVVTKHIADLEKDSAKLIEAKKLIRNLCKMVRALNDPNVQLTDVDYSLSEAEQFLKECE